MIAFFFCFVNKTKKYDKEKIKISSEQKKTFCIRQFTKEKNQHFSLFSKKILTFCQKHDIIIKRCEKAWVIPAFSEEKKPSFAVFLFPFRTQM